MENDDGGGGGIADQSYQLLCAQDSYPKQECIYEDNVTSKPFSTLYGEYAVYIGMAEEGCIGLTNYRLYLQQRDASFFIPLGLIETTECREIVHLWILCKDSKSYKCTFSSNEQCVEWQRRIFKYSTPPEELGMTFAYAFYQWTIEQNPDIHNSLNNGLENGTSGSSYLNRMEKMFDEEVQRMNFDINGSWRISKVNVDYNFCPSYPRKLIVPSSISDGMLTEAAKFRSSKRIPAIVFRYINGAVMARCSQPEVGWLGWRSNEDEVLVKSISEACAFDSPLPKSDVSTDSGSTEFNDSINLSSTPNDKEGLPGLEMPSMCHLPDARARRDIKKLLIIDARSYTTAFANRARGGGCESPDYYPTCEIQFMSLANIHQIRKSQQGLRQVVASSPDLPNWLTLLDSTKWFSHISGLLKAATTVAQAIAVEGRPVMVHCSDGWDRTPQITGLSQLLLDPYYRTFQGFQVLVEKEWIEFGHKFSDRCGSAMGCEDLNERCPIFLQWLDCIYQLLIQFPTAFQFNNSYLVKLAQHVYSNLFGTFLCNTSRERSEAETTNYTYSVWTYLHLNRHRLTNYLYNRTTEVLHPSCYVKDLQLWKCVYIPNVRCESDEHPTFNNLASSEEDEEELAMASSGGELVKTKSYDDLIGASPTPIQHNPVRRSSHPNIRDCSPNMSMLNSEELETSSTFPSATNCTDEESLQTEKEKDDSESLTLCDSAELMLEDEKGPPPAQSHSEDKIVINGKELLVENGEEASEFIFNSESENKDFGPRTETRSSTLVKNLNEACIEGSTDTLVAELSVTVIEEGAALICINGNKTDNHSKHSSNLVNGYTCNGHDNQETTHTNNAKKEKPAKRPLVNGSSVDSDDRRQLASPPSCPTCTQSKKLLVHLGISDLKNVKMENGTPRPATSSARISRQSTPSHSRTPSSCIPSPNCDERLLNSNNDVKIATLDGLSNINDEVNRRLQYIVHQYQNEIHNLKKDLATTKQQLLNQVNHNDCDLRTDNTEDQMSLPESFGSGSGGSTACESGLSDISSDLSMEGVDESEVRPTLWEPDHARNNCNNCKAQFWMGRRKHHCRNCGKIFCADCSGHYTPVPHEQLYDPVRVCHTCYDHFRPMNLVSVSN